MWTLTEEQFDPKQIYRQETIFTIGNGYLSTRGAFEEGYPKDHRATFVHGVFDDAPVVFTELANAPDWLPLSVFIGGERFSLNNGTIKSFERTLDLHNGVLTRKVHWTSPEGKSAELIFERFASLANPHLLLIRCRVTPESAVQVELRAGLHGTPDNEGRAHWHWVRQGQTGDIVTLVNRTRQTEIEYASAMRFEAVSGSAERDFWDVENAPTITLKFQAAAGSTIEVVKTVAVACSRDDKDPLSLTLYTITNASGWQTALADQQSAWLQEWERSDIIIDGDEEAQIAMRFNLFQLLIAAPRHDERVNIGAKTLSGFGYRGHCFWDTEIFMLPVFIYTAPHIARNLLNYRWHNLPGARAKALRNGFEGAQFPWESASEGTEVTPNFVPLFSDPSRLVRIWTGDIEIHISADIAYATYKYWKLTDDTAWFRERGAELVLDTAKFWGSRAEWNASKHVYEFSDTIGPDEYHEHVDNNAYTNRLAKWNLETALQVFSWLQETAPEKASQLASQLDLTEDRLARWQEIAGKIQFIQDNLGIVEQFEGYFQRQYIDLQALEPRDRSAQVIFGIEGCNQTQILKQPDVLMLFYLLPDEFSMEIVKSNYDFYTPRTDFSFGSSLGPSIQAIMACEVGQVDEAYEQFIRSVRADLRDVRGNAEDGIHAASAGGSWQAVVFGFGGLKIHAVGWTVEPRLPAHWKRLNFKFFYKGQLQNVLIENDQEADAIGELKVVKGDQS
jgi:trehalose/maltose hydrolase-like predicted phosphorylase